MNQLAHNLRHSLGGLAYVLWGNSKWRTPTRPKLVILLSRSQFRHVVKRLNTSNISSSISTEGKTKAPLLSCSLLLVVSCCVVRHLWSLCARLHDQITYWLEISPLGLTLVFCCTRTARNQTGAKVCPIVRFTAGRSQTAQSSFSDLSRVKRQKRKCMLSMPLWVRLGLLLKYTH